MPSNTSIVEEYREKFPSYSTFAQRLQDLISQLVERSGTKVHFIESRAKSPESFAEKIIRPGKQYDNPIQQLPDLVGVRVILYYTDSVPAVGSILKAEFSVLEEQSVHQADTYDADQFGYLSMHYVVTLHSKRRELPEWQEWAAVRAEIQVRTVLQHSWAAVSHALQYKREGDVPLGLRRRLHRLAGLFELADEEFVGIRNEADAITETIRVALKENSDAVPIDAQSLLYFLDNSPVFRRHCETALKLGYKFELPRIEDEDERIDYTGFVVEHCHTLGLKFVADLKGALDFNAKAFLDAAQNKERQWYVTNPFLALLLLIKARPDAFTVPMLVSEGFSDSIAKRVISAALSK